MWLDGADTSAASMSFSGSNVTSWIDKSGSGNTVSAASSQPTYTSNVQNGLGALTYNGTQNLGTGTINATQFAGDTKNFTCYCVFSLSNTNTLTNYSAPFCWANGGGFPRIAFTAFVGGTGTMMDVGSTNYRTIFSSPVLSTNNTFYFMSYSKNGGSTQLNMNGSNLASATGQDTATITGSYAFNVGNGFSNSQYYMRGNIGEILFYNSTLPTSNFQAVEGYLAWKWGLQSTLPSSHPYFKYPPFMNTINLPSIPSGPIQLQNGPVFVPTQISGCQVWFDAADANTFSTTGSNITQWRDKSSNAYSIGQSTATKQPFYIANAQNGLPGVQLTTTRFIYTESSNMPNFTTTAATTVFVAARNGSTGTGYNAINSVWLSGASALTTRYQLFFDRDSGSLSRGPNLYLSGTFRIQNTSNVIAASTAGVVGFTASASSILLSVNGNTSTAAGAAPTSANDATYFQFGDSRGISTLSSDVQIFEMIGYSVQLTTSERQQVEGYLAWKWGTQASLPTTHPYYKSPFPNQSMAPSPAYPPQIRAVSWVPTNILNISVWLDASDPSFVAVSGTAVTQWKDKSGQNNNTSSANGSPQYIQASLNKRAGIKLNGSTSYFTLPRVVTTDWSIFIVLTTTQTGPGSGGQWWAGAGIFDAEVGGTTTDFGTSLYGSSFATGVGNPPTGDNTVLSSTAINTGAGFICEFIRNSTSGFFENFVNGSTQGSATGGTGARTPSQIVIGAIQTLGAGTFLNGTMFEIITYTSVLTSQQRQQVEGYLAWKWGLQGSLPSNHPYKLFPPPP
jgi:hypothetical protein